MAQHQVLFCPFCRESFEGIGACPEHELTLVPLTELPARPEEQHEPDDDELPDAQRARELSLLDLRFGRGWVALGALSTAAALGLGLLRLEDGSVLRTYELARTRPSLWTLSLVSFTALYVLARRRSAPALYGLRLLVPLLALLSPLALLWVLARFPGSFTLGPASYAVALGTLCLLLGGARLGRPA